MKANETTINAYLSQANTQFIIPVYQRNYDWKKEQCQQLIDDILNTGKDHGISSHFIGSIVTIFDDVYSSSSVKELTVIDGQQRLTTITLVYIALLNLARKQNNIMLEEEITETYLINKFAADPEKLKLRPTENNDKALKSLLLHREDEFVEYSRIIENFNYLKGRINEHNQGIIREGLKKLVFVEISLDRDKDDSQRIFESLNSTGLDLSQADLIRNYILMNLKREDQQKIYSNYWQPIENACTHSESNANKVSGFIRDYLTIKNREIPNKSKVYQAFKSNFPLPDLQGLKEMLEIIRTYAMYYSKLINPEKEQDRDIRGQLHYINKLETTVSYPFLLEVYDDYTKNIIDKETFIEILELVQSFVWRRFIAGLPTNSLNKIFMKLYEEIDKSDYLQSLQRALVKRKSSQRFPRNVEILEILKEKDVYSIQTRNRMYFLDKLENFQNNEPVVLDNLTVEHIFPQRPDKKWRASLSEGDFQKMQDEFLNTIGNLTLSGNNGALGNKPFREKRDLPEKGYRDSRLFLNKHLASLEKWDVEELEKRFAIIMERFLRIWSYPDIPVDFESNHQEVNIFEAEDPKYKKLEYFIFENQKKIESNITTLYKYVMRELFRRHPETFFQTDLGEKVELNKDKTKMREARAISGSYYIDCNLSNRSKFERLKHALRIFDMTDDLFIKYAN